jgi:hypothetical protein
MAKELVIKVKVDGQEIDVAKKSTKELTDQIGALKDKLATVPLGSADFKKIQGDINNLEKGFQKAKNATQPFIESMSELPGVAGLAGQSIKGLKGGMDLLAQNPLIAVFSLLAMIVMKVVDKMKNLEGVMDPITKIGAIFSGIFEKIASVVLPPVVATLEAVAEAAASVGNFFGSLIGAGNDLGDTFSELADKQDALNDSQAEYELGLSKSSRALAEAREKANDQTLSTKERIAALNDASKIETRIAEQGKKRALDQARITATQMAASMDLTQTEIDGLKKASAVELEEFAKRIKNRKDLNQEQRTALLKSLGQIDEIAADEAKIEKKKDTQIRSIQNQADSDAKAAREKAATERKDYETRLLGFSNDIRLLGIKDEQEKARVSLEIEKKKTLDDIEALTMSSKRKAELKKQAELDYAAKSKVLIEKQQQETEDKIRTFQDKIESLEIAGYQKELDRQTASIDLKVRQDKIAISKDTEFKKKSKEEQERILGLIDAKAIIDKNKLIEDDAKKKADLAYKQIEFERQSRLMGLQTQLMDIDNANKTEIEKIQARSVILDQQAQIDRDKEVENLKKLLDAKELTQKEYDDRKALLDEKQRVTVAANAIKTEKDLTNQRKANLDAVQQLATAIGALGQAMGEETAAGRILIKVSQGLALATTAVALADSLAGLGKALKLPFPANVVAVTATLGLMATAFSQFKALSSGFNTDASGPSGGQTAGPTMQNTAGYADGGMINGPLHAGGGVMVNAEGGEAIMTRGAVTMFGPLLSQLNQAGGGTSFSNMVGTGQSRNDNPQSSSQSDQMIIKTYVVENELTTSQHRQARLKDLSTL